jgi:hypothetical protein
VRVRRAQDIGGRATSVPVLAGPWPDAAVLALVDDAAIALPAGSGVDLDPAGQPGPAVRASARVPAVEDLGPAAAALLGVDGWAEGTLRVGVGPAERNGWADRDAPAITVRPASSAAAVVLPELTAAGVPVTSGAVARTAAWLRVPPEQLALAEELVARAAPGLDVRVLPTAVPDPAATRAPRPRPTKPVPAG